LIPVYFLYAGLLIEIIIISLSVQGFADFELIIKTDELIRQDFLENNQIFTTIKGDLSLLSN